MKHLPRRSALAGAAVGVLAAALLLAACSKKEDTPATAPAPGATAAAAPASAASGPLKIAFVYIDPVGDAGWTFAHDTARKAMEKALGDKVRTSIVEKVPEGADAERVFRDLAAQGNGLIFGTSFGYMEPMLKAAADNPNVKFEHATGYKTAPNLRTYDSRTYEGAYLAGIVAGGMTKTGKLGVVGSVPIPEVIRNIDSFALGAQSVNPNVTVKVVWVNEWYNPPKETEGAQSLIDGGADVLFQNTDSTAVLQAAEKNGKYGLGWDSDMSGYGPKAHLASAVINWAPYYIKSAQDVLAGTWATGHAWWGVKEGAIDLVSISDKVPADVKARVDKAKAGLQDGSFAIWKGPITGSDGKEVLAAGTTADDMFLGRIKFYVKGVEGRVPGVE
jgi:simple sugar transport system substrate-binding protein